MFNDDSGDDDDDDDRVHSAPLRSSSLSQRKTNHHGAPAHPKCRARKSSKDLPLQVDSQKLAPLFVGPVVIIGILKLSTVHLKLPPSLNVRPTFHISQLKMVCQSDLFPSSEPTSPRVI